MTSTILFRTAVFVATGLLLLFGGWFLPKKGRIWTWATPVLGLLGWLLLVVGATQLGGRATALVLVTYDPTMHELPLRVGAVIGALAALWLAVISTQIVENLARLLQGLPPHKIEWIKRDLVRRKQSL